jgi:radical SAM protein with 4Fe4S-binding SPASM domain
VDTFDYVQHFVHRLASAHDTNRLLQVELHPGLHCDLFRCPHCYGHGQQPLAGKTLSVDEVAAALDDVLVSKPTVIVSGVTTEPLTHPDAAAMLAQIRHRHLPLGLYTKGRRLEGDVVDALLEGSGECFVTVSLDEIDPTRYVTRHGLSRVSQEGGAEGLVGAEYFQRVLDNVDAFKTRRDAVGASLELRVALLLFADNSNERDVLQAVDALVGMADRVRIGFPQDRNDGQPPGPLPADPGAVLQSLTRRFGDNPKVKILLNTATPMRDPHFSRCGVQRFQVTIDRSGNVFPCPQVAVYPFRHLSFGNIRDEPLSVLLRSARRRDMFHQDVDRDMRCRICDRKDEAINVALNELSVAFDSRGWQRDRGPMRLELAHERQSVRPVSTNARPD